jgi:hypothetical protein
MLACLRGFVLLATLTAGHCQFLLRGGGGGSSFVSSFSSSSSWFQGRDGQMHKQTQESRTEIVQDPNGMKKQKQTKTVCRDGHCAKVIEEVMPGAVQERQRMRFLHRVSMPSTGASLHANMQALLQRLSSDDRMGGMLQGPSIIVSLPQQKPEAPPPAQPQSQHHWSPAMDVFKRVHPFMSSASGGLPPTMSWDRVEPIPGMRVISAAAPAHKETKSLRPFNEWASAWLRGENLTMGEKNLRNTMLTRVAAISCGSLTALMIVMLLAKFFRHSGIFASARERPLQALAEPLAAGESPVPEAQKSAVNPDAVQDAEYAELKAAAQMYLSRVYVRFFD